MNKAVLTNGIPAHFGRGLKGYCLKEFPQQCGLSQYQLNHLCFNHYTRTHAHIHMLTLSEQRFTYVHTHVIHLGQHIEYFQCLKKLPHVFFHAVQRKITALNFISTGLFLYLLQLHVNRNRRSPGLHAILYPIPFT